MKQLHAIVEGRVQGVYFRDFVRQHAQQLRITGWVANMDDGRVEVIAEGDDVPLAQLVRLLEEGSPMSRVEAVYTSYAPSTDEFSDFRIRR